MVRPLHDGRLQFPLPDAPQGVMPLRQVFRRHATIEAVQPQALAGGVAEDLFGRARPARDAQSAIGFHHAPWCIEHVLLQQPVRPTQRFGQHDVVVDIERNGIDGRHLAVRGEFGKHLDPAPARRLQVGQQAFVLGWLALEGQCKGVLGTLPGLDAVKLGQGSAEQGLRRQPGPAQVGRIAEGQAGLRIPAADGKVDGFEQAADRGRVGEIVKRKGRGHAGLTGACARPHDQEAAVCGSAPA